MMKIIVGRDRYRLDDDHPYAITILALAQQYEHGVMPGQRVATPERNDVKKLWSLLNDHHRELLRVVAQHPPRIAQPELQTMLNLAWQGLRGVHNGLTRICEGSGYEKPIRVIGYNASNRSYSMDPDVRATVLALVKRSKD